MQRQQPSFHNGWSYFFEHPITGAGAQSNKETNVQAEKDLSEQHVVKQGTIPIAPPIIPIVPQCGKGSTMPARSLIDGKVSGSGTTAATGPWQFLVSCF